MGYGVTTGDEAWTLLAAASGGTLVSIRCHCTACGATIGLDLDDKRTTIPCPACGTVFVPWFFRQRSEASGEAGPPAPSTEDR